ncbi:carboxypeptidase-like regulatory domain-containing protein [Spirillospora sp. NPDC052269]
MRRTLAASLSLLAALAFVPALPAAADGRPVLIYQTDLGDGKGSNEVLPLVRLAPTSTIARVDMSLRAKGGATPYLTLEDVPRQSSTQWGPAAPVRLQPGRTYLDVAVTDRSGARTEFSAVSFVDTPERGFTIAMAYGAYDPTGPFDLWGGISGLPRPQKVTAQLFRAGTNDPVSPEVAMGRPSDSTELYKTDRVVDAPVGSYESVVKACDAQDDCRTLRSWTFQRKLAQRFVDLKTDPAWTDLHHPAASVTVTGRLVGADGEPLAGVDVEGASNGTTETAKTAADGAFTLTLSPFGYLVTLTAPAHGDYVRATESAAPEHRRLPTRLTLASSAAKAHVDADVTVKGTLVEPTSSGGSAPLSGKTIEIKLLDPRGMSADPAQQVVTGPDGSYTARIRAMRPGDLSIVARFKEDSDYTASVASVPLRADYLIAMEPEGNTPPAHAAVGSKITLDGRLLQLGGIPDPNLLTDPVYLEFSTDRKNWTRVTQARPGQEGEFSLTGTIAKDGYWRARYPGSAQRSALPVTGTTYYVDAVVVRHHTAISEFNASPEPVRKGRPIKVSGRLNRHLARWVPAPGATLTIYFKPRGSSKWRVMATVRTGGDGRFVKKFKASADGTWAAAYAGSANYLGDWSEGDYVDVR